MGDNDRQSKRRNHGKVKDEFPKLTGIMPILSPAPSQNPQAFHKV